MTCDLSLLQTVNDALRRTTAVSEEPTISEEPTFSDEKSVLSTTFFADDDENAVSSVGVQTDQVSPSAVVETGRNLAAHYDTLV